MSAPEGSSNGPLTTGAGLPRSEQPLEHTVVERATDALRDVPGLVRLQKDERLLGKVRGALGDEEGTRGARADE